MNELEKAIVHIAILTILIRSVIRDFKKSKNNP